jgi:predicted ATPase
MARLDRIGSAKEVAQVGAAIGREFSHALLAAVTHKAEVELQSALDRLMAQGTKIPELGVGRIYPQTFIDSTPMPR